MKLDRNDWVVTKHPDGSPAIYRKSRVHHQKYYEANKKRIYYDNGMVFTVRTRVD